MNLHNGLRRRGHDVRLAVGRKSHTEDPDVHEISRITNHLNPIQKILQFASGLARQTHYRRCEKLLEAASFPFSFLARQLGWEIFDHPGSRALLNDLEFEPELIHCHNLHGDYFDLRVLPDWTRWYPVLLDVRDMWLVTGHCAHSFGCLRFLSGCGRCPDLTIPPAIKRDGTAFNLKRKKTIYSRSRLYVSAPSRWMLSQLEGSVLRPALSRVIPNGIDLSVFRPGDQTEARRRLSLSSTALVVLFSCRQPRSNPFKDYGAMEAATRRLGGLLPGRELVFLILGEAEETRTEDNITYRYVPFTTSPEKVAATIQAADLYIHATKAESFGKSITEAMACGVPVVATAVGGIFEQIRDLETIGPGKATGSLVPPAELDRFVSSCERILLDDDLRARLGENAAALAQAQFSLQRQLKDYEHYYRDIQEDWQKHRTT